MVDVHIPTDDPQVEALTTAIQQGHVAGLRRLLDQRPELATARFGTVDGMSRTSLHVATDWPGHFPDVAASIAALLTAGADIDARFAGPHRETPLHWAASSDDIDALDALLDAGADIEADGGVLSGGTPLDDAVIFGQWNAARRLVARGATTKLFHAAALGDPARVAELLRDPPPLDQITSALWHACNNGQLEPALLLLEAGADPLWVGDDDRTPLQAARGSANEELAAAVAAWAAG